MLSFFDFLGRAVCHQVLERSFLVDGKPLMVCARCSGLYSSFLFSFLFLYKFSKEYQPKKDFILALALVSPLAFDGALSYLGWWQTNNYLRWITGVLSGFSFSLLLLPSQKRGLGLQINFLPYLIERAKVLGVVFVLLLIIRFLGQYYLESFLIISGIFLLFLLINFYWLEWALQGEKLRTKAFLLAVILAVGELLLLNFFHIHSFFS